MKHKYTKIAPLLLVGAMLLTGCGTNATTSVTSNSTKTSVESQTEQVDESSSDKQSTSNEATTEATESEYFSNRDLSGEVDESEAIEITLNKSEIITDSEKVSISGTTITITEEGTYILSGELEDGSVIIDASKDAKIQLVLNNVEINSKTFAPIYVAQADKVFITLAEGSTNALSNGGSFEQIDDNDVDAVIFSKDDITLNGTGILTIISPAGHGIVGKDEVTITDGTYNITALKNAIRANDSIAIADGNFTLNADSDGLHAEKNDDDSFGSIYIKDGIFNIDAKDDGIHATTTLIVDGGDFNIKAAEGMEATNITINGGDISIEASDDGINAANKSSLYDVKITFNGGSTTIVMGAGDTDGVDSNGDIEVNGGTINVTGNSTFDYDGSGVINGGTVIVNGEEVTSLPNQMMGGGMGKMQNGQNGPNGFNGQNKQSAPDGSSNQNIPNGMGDGKQQRTKDL